MLLKLVLALPLLSAIPAATQDLPPTVVPEAGAVAHAFPLNQVSLSNSRWMDNQNRTLNYLKSVDTNRLLYNFRNTHKLSTNGARANGGWDAPNFPFRSHSQGHYLTAWANCYAVLRDPECGKRASSFVAELAKCQANNGAAGFTSGYLSGFPESEFDALEARRLSNGNVPYYAIHKTMAGLLDVWRIMGDTKARDVLLGMSAWVDTRTKKLSSSQMQSMLGTEFGGMNDILANVYQLTGDKRWLTVAQRFDHAAVFDPLAANQDRLNGLHANTQVPKWIGAIREYQATGSKRYLDIARNAWDFTVKAHTYAIGGNSQAEHFRPPNAIAQYLSKDTAEQCNTYNMLKLTRDLWTTDPDNTKYFDYYEQALMNHLLGAQNPSDNHGHITYFTPLNPGGRRGVGPAWGGGTWSTDYDSFWCCQGTALETNTKLMDSIYWNANSTVYVNLFIPSVLQWSQKDVTLTQTTSYPVEDSTKIVVAGAGDFSMRIRIPSWASGASISINGQDAGSAQPKAGTYAVLDRSWKSGDTVTVRFPMKLRTVPANDNSKVAAVAYGPAILSGNYGSSTLTSTPTLALDTIKRTSTSKLTFTATANGRAVELGAFYDAHGYNYNVYWSTTGTIPNGV